MVNSGNPSNDRVTLRSYYSRHEASHKPQPSSEHPNANNFFRRNFSATYILTDRHTNRSISLRSTLRWKPCRKIHLHMPIYSLVLKFTLRHVAAHEKLFRHAPPPTMSPDVDEPLQPPVVFRHHKKTPLFPLFLSGDCFWTIISHESPSFLSIMKLYDTFRAMRVVCSFKKF